MDLNSPLLKLVLVGGVAYYAFKHGNNALVTNLGGVVLGTLIAKQIPIVNQYV